MADTPGNLSKIQEEESEYKDPQGSLYRKIDANINALIDAAQGKGFLGEIKHSVLTEEQFQSRRGTQWVIMKGQDISGSGLATLLGITNLPDMRGKYPRMLDNGAGIDPARTLGSEQGDNLGSHGHSLAFGVLFGGTGILKSAPSPAKFLFTNSGATALNAYDLIQTNATPSIGETSTEGGEIGKPRSYFINYFIRINVL